MQSACANINAKTELVWECDTNTMKGELKAICRVSSGKVKHNFTRKSELSELLREAVLLKSRGIISVS